MNTFRVSVVVLALGSLATLPACSAISERLGMGGHSTAGMSAPMTARTAVAPDLVRQVQTELQQQGIYKGNVDGVWGSETQSAVRSYQGSHDLTASGQLDQPTLKALNVASMSPGDTSMGTGSSTTQPAVSGSPMTTTPPGSPNP